MNSELDKLQKRLYDAGVRDIKIFFDPDKIKKLSRDMIEVSVTMLLNDYLDGNKKPLGLIGDGSLKLK